MLTRLIALFAVACAAAYPAGLSSPAAIGLFYSFDRPRPDSATLREMRAELARILLPSGITVEWRAIADPPAAEFPEIFVVRFRGTCSAERASSTPRVGLDGVRTSLAKTRIENGRMLPFSEVDCDSLERYIAPVGSMSGDIHATLGRALARVVAHEFYHMLTRSPSHGRDGIARAEYSRTELTARTFRFAAAENEWLHRWAETRLLTLPRTSLANPADTSGSLENPVWQGTVDDETPPSR